MFRVRHDVGVEHGFVGADAAAGGLLDGLVVGGEAGVVSVGSRVEDEVGGGGYAWVYMGLVMEWCNLRFGT